ncbi:LOW QUALITY PROTEIN: uncharacterized protein PAF06_007132 [Gastrophryne carolinensis]
MLLEHNLRRNLGHNIGPKQRATTGNSNKKDCTELSADLSDIPKRVQDSSVLPICCFTPSASYRKYGGISQAVQARTGANVPRKGDPTAGKNKEQLIADLVEYDARAAELSDVRLSPTAGNEGHHITPHQDSTPHEALDSYMRTALQHLGDVDANIKLQLLLQYQTAEREAQAAEREAQAAEREAQRRHELEVLRLRGDALSTRSDVQGEEDKPIEDPRAAGQREDAIRCWMKTAEASKVDSMAAGYLRFYLPHYLYLPMVSGERKVPIGTDPVFTPGKHWTRIEVLGGLCSAMVGGGPSDLLATVTLAPGVLEVGLGEWGP